MKSQVLDTVDPSRVLSDAVLNAGKALGLTRAELAQVIGRTRSRLGDDIKPSSKTGTLALYLVRIYRSLYALVDGDEEEMKLWMKGENLGTGGVPIEQVKDVVGLVHVMEYLDGMRGKV